MGRKAEHEIDPAFLARWSPRAFTDEEIAPSELLRLFEAAHWAPSAFNLEPWRFVYVYVRRGGPGWDNLLGLLIVYNQAWAQRGAGLIFILSARWRTRSNCERERRPACASRWRSWCSKGVSGSSVAPEGGWRGFR